MYEPLDPAPQPLVCPPTPVKPLDRKSRVPYHTGEMGAHQSKSAVAASMGIDLPTGAGLPDAGQTRAQGEKHGTEIVRRAAYGKVSPDSLSAFLAAYMDCGHKAKAALAAGLSYSSILRAEKDDPEFADEVVQAHELFTAKLSDAAYRAAVEGWKVPKYDAKGNLCGHEWKFSERILELMLKRHDPSFRDKHDVDVKHSGGVVVVQAPAMSVDDWTKQVANQGNRREVIDMPTDRLPER